MDELVSVIMTTYKEDKDILRKAVESILNQTYTNLQFVIVLDNPDNQEHDSILSQYAQTDSRITYYVKKENRGRVKSLNKTLELAKGNYIAVMDADDIAVNTRIEKQMQYLLENDYDLIGGNTQLIDENGNPFYSIAKLPTEPETIKKIIRYNQCIAHPSWLAKRQVYEKLNGYVDVDYCEDYEFTLRALQNGFKVSNINEVVLNYRLTQKSISRTNLLPQFLYTKFLSRAYKKQQPLDVQQAKKYVEKRFTQAKSRRYVLSNRAFYHALSCIQSKKYASAFVGLCRAFFGSWLYAQKMLRLLIVSF